MTGYLHPIQDDFPMLLISVEDFTANDGILEYSEVKRKNQHVPYDSITERCNKLVVYVSYTQAGNDRAKYETILEGLLKIQRNVGKLLATYVWVDYSCIPTGSSRLQKRMLAIGSLAGYVERCDLLLSPIVSDAQMSKSERKKVKGIDSINLNKFTLDLEHQQCEQTRAHLNAKLLFSSSWSLCEMFLGAATPPHTRLDQHFDLFNRLSCYRQDRPHLLVFSDANESDMPLVLPKVTISTFEEVSAWDTDGLSDVELECITKVLEQIKPHIPHERGPQYRGPVDAKGDPHGPGGRMVYSTHAVYSGDWVHGMRDGRGVYLSSTGDRYDGEWKEDRMHGKGTLTFVFGNKYQGEFKQGLRDGQGTEVSISGVKFTAQWQKGIAKNGTYTTKSGENIIEAKQAQLAIARSVRGNSKRGSVASKKASFAVPLGGAQAANSACCVLM